MSTRHSCIPVLAFLLGLSGASRGLCSQSPGMSDPSVAITNDAAVVTYDVSTCDLGGWANANVVGTMVWTNSLTGDGGAFAAVAEWVLYGLPLGVGDNVFAVTGTNVSGVAASKSVSITRGGPGTGMPFVDITDEDTVVGNAVTTWDLSGTANTNVVGDLAWQNNANRAMGTIPAASSWQVLGIALAVGDNAIMITGTNLDGTEAVDTLLVTREAATHLVWQGSPSPTPPFLTWATAATNIQDAVDAAEAGDRVLVTNGVYDAGSAIASEMPCRVALTVAVTVQSVNGPAVTSIQGVGPAGASAVRCAYVGDGAVLSGFTLTNGATYTKDETSAPAGWCGGGAYCDGAGTISNCVIAGNSADDSGGGVYGGVVFDSVLAGNAATNNGGGAYQSTVTRCRLTGNQAYYGGGQSYGTAVNSVFDHNRAIYGGGGAYYVTPLGGCALNLNEAGHGGGGLQGGSFYNCTVVLNSADEGGGAIWANGYNSILYANQSRTMPDAPNVRFGSLEYCCEPFAAGIGCLKDDPLLASSTHLSAGSPCRGAGLDGSPVDTDLDGDYWLSPPSMGCDEYIDGARTGDLAVSINARYAFVAPGYPAPFAATIDGRTTGSRWDFGGGLIVSNAVSITKSWATTGTYDVVLTAFNEDHPDGVSTTLHYQVVAGTYYADAACASPSPPYASWSTAATTLQDAVDAAVSGGVGGAIVLATNGVYDVGGRTAPASLTTNRLLVSGAIVVRSVNGPDMTFLVGWQANGGAASVRCAWLDQGARLEGFALTNGGTVYDPMYWNESQGGGVLAMDAGSIVSNCVIVGCVATNGGGAYGGQYVDCRFFNNQAQYGAGAYEATLRHCLLRDNAAAYDGGGVYAGQMEDCLLIGNLAGAAMSGGAGGGAVNPTLVSRCTLIGNRADSGGGCYGGNAVHDSVFVGNTAVVQGGGVMYGTLYNCTMVDNTALGGAGGGVCYVNAYNSIMRYNTATSGADYDGGSWIDHCCAEPVFSGGGNIGGNPCFADTNSWADLRLTALSPCVDAGDNGEVYAGVTVDREGLPRFAGGSVDMGAYEFQGTPAPMVSFAVEQETVEEDVGTVDIVAMLDMPAPTDLTAVFTQSGSATYTADYTLSASSFFFPAGSQSATVTVTVVDDALPENDETAILTFDAPAGLRVGTPPAHTLTIARNDGMPAILSFSIDSGAAYTVSPDVTLDSVCDGTPLQYLASEDAAFTGAVWQVYAPSVPFALTASPGLKIVYFKVRVADGVGGYAETPVVKCTITRIPSLAEALDVTIPVTTGGTDGGVVGWYGQCDESHDGVDAARSVSFDGYNGTSWIEMNVNGPGDVSFWWKVHNNSGGAYSWMYFYVDGAYSANNNTMDTWLHVTRTLTAGPHTLRWAYYQNYGSYWGWYYSGNGEVDQVELPPPAVSFTNTSETVDEAVGTVALTATLSRACTGDVSVAYALSGTATPMDDYTVADSAFFFPAGSTSATVHVSIVNDALPENAETVVIALQPDALSVVAGATLTNTLTIAASDISPLQIVTPELPAGPVGVPYSFALAGIGGLPPYVWSVANGGDYAESDAANSYAAVGAYTGWNADDWAWDLALPFSFPYFGTTNTHCWVNSNGKIRFDASDSSLSGDTSDLYSKQMLAVLGRDLVTSIYYESPNSHECTIRWSGSYYGNGGTPVAFAVTLFDNGTIRMTYGAGNANGGLIGISDGSGTNYLVSTRSNAGSQNLAPDIVFTPSLSLPSGFAISTNGVLSGTPLAVGTNEVTVSLTDSTQARTNRTYELVIEPGGPSPVILTVTTPDATVPLGTLTGVIRGVYTGVEPILWTNSLGGAGASTMDPGTNTWQALVGLASGVNVITFRAADTTSAPHSTIAVVNQATVILLQ